MRTVSASLAAAQDDLARTPYIALVLDNISSTDPQTIPMSRLLLVDHHEEAYNDYATVVVNNYDRAYDDLDLRGYWTEIGYGDVTGSGNESAATPRLWVKHQQIVSIAGYLVMILELEGMWARCRETKLRLGSPPYYSENYTTDTIYDILDIIFTEVGFTLAALASSDGIIDVLEPNFAVNEPQPFESAAEVIYRLIKMTFSFLRPKPSLGFEVVFPEDGDSPDITFYSNQQPYFYEYVLRNNLTVPNHIYVFSNAGADLLWTSIIASEATDAASIAAYGDIPDIVLAPEIDNQTDSDNRAEVVLARQKSEDLRGSLIIPHDCRIELYDYVAVSDTRGT